MQKTETTYHRKSIMPEISDSKFEIGSGICGHAVSFHPWGKAQSSKRNPVRSDGSLPQMTAIAAQNKNREPVLTSLFPVASL